MKRVVLSFLALLAISVTARAQSIQPPWVYPPTLTTTPVQVLPLDPIRRRIFFSIRPRPRRSPSARLR
jgi:hypothetical protein